jgi:hypothetical protein
MNEVPITGVGLDTLPGKQRALLEVDMRGHAVTHGTVTAR